MMIMSEGVETSSEVNDQTMEVAVLAEIEEKIQEEGMIGVIGNYFVIFI